MTSKKQTQLPWSHEQQECLLELVQSKGLHLTDGKTGVNDEWKLLNTELFNNDVCKSYADHYNPDIRLINTEKLEISITLSLKKFRKILIQGTKAAKKEI